MIHVAFNNKNQFLIMNNALQIMQIIKRLRLVVFLANCRNEIECLLNCSYSIFFSYLRMSKLGKGLGVCELFLKGCTGSKNDHFYFSFLTCKLGPTFRGSSSSKMEGYTEIFLTKIRCISMIFFFLKN